MKGLAPLFLGIFGTFAFSWVGLTMIPNWQIGHLDPQMEEDGTDVYPQPQSGMVERGSRVYAANGCIYCHSQQVRADYAADDIERKWGDRRSAPRDYIFERPIFLGKMRMGQDLSNIGARAPAEQENVPPAGAASPAAQGGAAAAPPAASVAPTGANPSPPAKAGSLPGGPAPKATTSLPPAGSPAGSPAPSAPSPPPAGSPPAAAGSPAAPSAAPSASAAPSPKAPPASPSPSAVAKASPAASPSPPAGSPGTSPGASPSSPPPKAPAGPAPKAPLASPSPSATANASPGGTTSVSSGTPAAEARPVQTTGEPPMYSAAWQHVHLYSPRRINVDSNM